LSFMDAVHLASSRQVHLSFNGVIVDVGAPATRNMSAASAFLRCSPIKSSAEWLQSGSQRPEFIGSAIV
jgi:hypothetical protein